MPVGGGISEGPGGTIT